MATYDRPIVIWIRSLWTFFSAVPQSLGLSAHIAVRLHTMAKKSHSYRWISNKPEWGSCLSSLPSQSSLSPFPFLLPSVPANFVNSEAPALSSLPFIRMCLCAFLSVWVCTCMCVCMCMCFYCSLHFPLLPFLSLLFVRSRHCHGGGLSEYLFLYIHGFMPTSPLVWLDNDIGKCFRSMSELNRHEN